MAYTFERLNHVKSLFYNPTTNTVRTLSKGFRLKYCLRKRNQNNRQTSFSTWFDDDDTDYDPRKERIGLKRKRPFRSNTDPERPAKQTKSPVRLVVIMTITSPAGKALLESLPIYQDDSSDHEDERLTDGEIIQPGKSGYALRNRESSLALIETPPYDLDLGQAGAQAYKDEGIDCDLSTQPTWKRACENCKQEKKACSYKQDDTEHHLPCKLCRELGITCIAEPARFQPGTGDLFVDEEDLDVEMTSARPVEITDSTKDTGLAGPSPDPEPSLTLPEHVDKPSAPPSANETNQSSLPITRFIHTSLAHPINFAYVPPEDGSNPCSWCSNFAYGIMGLGKRRVEVLDFRDGRYMEISGGHVASGHEPSRMCYTCALERIHIMRCPGHNAVPLKGYNASSFDLEAAYNSLIPVPGQGTHKKINLWCSLCPNPAFFGCNALQSVNIYQEPVSPTSPDVFGCGLFLCESCEVLLRAYRGNLEQVVARNDQADGEFGSRADALYLLPGNDLYRFYTRS